LLNFTLIPADSDLAARCTWTCPAYNVL